MKPVSFRFGRVFTLLALLCTCLEGLAQQPVPVDSVTKKEGKILVKRAGKVEELSENITLPGEIKVLTNGNFQVKQGKERLLAEGQVLGKDGTLISLDGTTMPVVDHVVIRNGRAVLVKDGEPSPLKSDVTLVDGSKISPDGTMVSSTGTRTRLLDGQIYKTDGAALPAVDTVTLQGGKVFVQKDGSQLLVAPGRSIMMSEGTKVFGNGTIVRSDGSTVKLAEGQIITLDGVARR